MINCTKGMLSGVFYSAYVALRLRREACVPIELMRFPCLELEGMTIRAANAEACALLGEDPVGRPFVALLDGDARRVWRRENARRLASRIEYLGETRLNCRNGQVGVRLMLLRGRQRTTLLLSASSHQSEDARPAALDTMGDAAASPLEMLGSDALADLTHEMRTPLTVIRSAASLLRERPEACEQYLRGIERNCERLQRIVNEILTLNTTGTCECAAAPVELRSWLSDLLDSVRPQAQDRGITLDFSAPELVLSTDAGRLEHILLNLLSNALKFTPDGGRISVRLERTDDGAHITVADNGCGIPPQELAHIFERGHTGDARRGSGLGLALAARLAADLGGRLTAASDGVSGSAFTLELPNMAHMDSRSGMPSARYNAGANG